MLPATRRPLERLRRGLGSPPGPRGWRDLALALALYLTVAAPLAHTSGLIRLDTPPAWTPELLLRLLLLPALLEEVVFRGLLNPHPKEDTPPHWPAALSLTAYVAAHPLAALLWRPAAKPVFTDPTFLLLTTLLGAAAWLLYRRSGSLWGAIALHWVVVVGWLSFGGLGRIGMSL